MTPPGLDGLGTGTLRPRQSPGPFARAWVGVGTCGCSDTQHIAERSLWLVEWYEYGVATRSRNRSVNVVGEPQLVGC